MTPGYEPAAILRTMGGRLITRQVHIAPLRNNESDHIEQGSRSAYDPMNTCLYCVRAVRDAMYIDEVELVSLSFDWKSISIRIGVCRSPLLLLRASPMF